MPGGIEWAYPETDGRDLTSGSEGTVLRINEETPSLTQAETSCPLDGCNKVVTQCVDVTAPLTMTPTAVLGSMSVTCQGAPRVVCTADASGESCTVTMTQQVCVSVPVRFGVSIAAGDKTIGCADSRGCGCR